MRNWQEFKFLVAAASLPSNVIFHKSWIMITVTYLKNVIRLNHIWFADADDIARLAPKTRGADLLFVHGSEYTALPHSVRLSSQHSLIKNLDADENVVYQTFGKHLRKFIQRSANEGTVIRILSGAEITEQVLDTCLRLYNKMKEDKGLPGTFNTTLAKQYAASGNLLVSHACIGDTVVGFKASIVDANHLRGWVSAFAFREEEFDAQVVSRAHQLLEWETMRHCCQNGIVSYDFGGIDSFENPNGIDKFKMTFAKEGQRVTYDNYLVGVSPVGKLAVLGYQILRKIRK